MPTAILAALALLSALPSRGGGADGILPLVFRYAAGTDTAGPTKPAYAYRRFVIRVERRNPTLMAVPSMYSVARGGQRSFAGEYYDSVAVEPGSAPRLVNIVGVTTVPRQRTAMPTIAGYLVPMVYSPTMVDGHLLSPFHKSNSVYYSYKQDSIEGGLVWLRFKPKINNTQLVSGSATVEASTGRVVATDFEGEYDMIRFRLSVRMGLSGRLALVPSYCRAQGRFSFMGNVITSSHTARIGLEKTTPGGTSAAARLEAVRPEPLPQEIGSIIAAHLAAEAKKKEEEAADTAAAPKRNWAKYILWDIIGDHLLNDIRSDFGDERQGNFRINPILNPLYMGYSDRKGVTYKFDVRGGYAFTPNRDISVRIKAGYSFKTKQPYLKAPLRFNYNKRRHGSLLVETNLGHRFYNSDIAGAEIAKGADTAAVAAMGLDDFRDDFYRILNTYDISDKWSFEVGFAIHHRAAVNRAAFERLGYTAEYRSVAPMVQWQYRPAGWDGPAITVDWERSFQGFMRANTAYERWEIDASYSMPLARLQNISLRLGGGFYSRRSGEQLFVDYSNFRDNNLIGGWNDEWSGEFELLRGEHYNSSPFYLRFNSTYEAPLMLLSRIPFVGRFIEVERAYLGGVVSSKLHPYVEAGYGFTTRWVSAGAFASLLNGRYGSAGVKFGFELFRNW